MVYYGSHYTHADFGLPKIDRSGLKMFHVGGVIYLLYVFVQGIYHIIIKIPQRDILFILIRYNNPQTERNT